MQNDYLVQIFLSEDNTLYDYFTCPNAEDAIEQGYTYQDSMLMDEQIEVYFKIWALIHQG
jgi:hypothetical protein